ncbi:TRAP transporter substrate-binding protein [Thermodesulforhabdus norvegica]|uniref:Tripartite ATP-independent transporter solute receptor, DctP family n=1 Tax=Thermodesulforhabdus norvegica TaxID=39841 RepID=A0A1I4QR74_9BACT|nr:TRAP transporter substrate-binding protein [Thermodesulforhabdus norvegica]SFM42578.1 tripartite ATP-independent transporter solute receptor, DctP family [Thermodesulforhabdus norvegica]
MSRKALSAFLMLCFLVGFFSVADARETIKLGVVTKPGSAQNICAEKFKELLESRSDKYEVKIYHSASLGTETEILQQIQLGTVQMGIITSGPFDVFLPEARVIDYPFLFSSYEEVDRVLDGEPGRLLLKRLERVGFKGLSFSENGFRHLTNNKRPVHSVDDVKGLKIRVMESVLHKELWRLLGANPTPMGWPIYTELQQGTIDAQENPLWVIWTYKLYEVQKYLTLTHHVYSAHIDIANLKWFNGLPPEDQKLIEECMIEAAHYQRRWNRQNEATFLKNLKEAGMIVDEHPDLESFRARVKGIRELDIFRAKEVQELLPLFLRAVGRE